MQVGCRLDLRLKVRLAHDHLKLLDRSICAAKVRHDLPSYTPARTAGEAFLLHSHKVRPQQVSQGLHSGQARHSMTSVSVLLQRTCHVCKPHTSRLSLHSQQE